MHHVPPPNTCHVTRNVNCRWRSPQTILGQKNASQQKSIRLLNVFFSYLFLCKERAIQSSVQCLPKSTLIVDTPRCIFFLKTFQAIFLIVFERSSCSFLILQISYTFLRGLFISILHLSKVFYCLLDVFYKWQMSTIIFIGIIQCLKQLISN